MKITKQQLKQLIKEEQTKVLIEHELRKLKRIDEGKMKDLAKRFGVPLALVAAIAAGIEAPTSVDIPAEAPGVEQTVDAPEETEEKGRSTSGRPRRFVGDRSRNRQTHTDRPGANDDRCHPAGRQAREDRNGNDARQRQYFRARFDYVKRSTDIPLDSSG